ncbi:protein WHAT'S THIS FACTOR 1 homolog, chloroplastic-like [Diospyros lotus]|uniref:protein WHAT'S THIS FACTOR 1 homolog, chloroplastic-like n=1 Tax=Diospyros lotus TaxID=55363 RepID=UPI002259164E|nr:protein WHAT'S THIS FACTOR 1 homolog, chloroplastic-like [Diospyros lotus]XP_052178381.1 protein WHAT'S THIS FACTOR 1 homolog, chloroplastic-like [Diospyros lotus]XP_052178382.1 protein WHAT'S THIS FACTOR 1 homolog, chloroplastic-like [Diospyros lotus]XP_052178383.1 protein WHAT'S THIS FACTOR 1 homolog, chloroplastic-like [Diospyros lotus]XP_052178384.1 protein WHAT'S THIS FACTOR 1 homolog, chloroplastic-like [Diospyros lotus]
MTFGAIKVLLNLNKSNVASVKCAIFSIQHRCVKSFLGTIYSVSQYRSMTTSKRIQDRSKKKRVHDLEIATEKWKIASKVLFLLEILKQEPEQIIPIRSLDHYRRQINLPKPNKISDFIRKCPKLFELYKDHKGVLWCGMTKQAEELVQEEERIIETYSEKAAEHVARFLMMSVDKRLPLDKLAHFRRDFGFPIHFRRNWIYRYPQHFRVVKNEDDIEFLELVSWNPSWAVTELEKKVIGMSKDHQPGLLSLSFALKFPPDYKKVYRYGGKIDHFQKRTYLSPYADARGLKAGSLEFDKRAVAVMHELLSFTIEKRLVTDHLTHFRRELVMPQKLMRLLLKHFGIFYVSERGKRASVFLTEAYEGSELIEKLPYVLWKEKVQSLTGYRGRQKKIQSFDDLEEMEDRGLFKSEFEEDIVYVQSEKEDNLSSLEDSSLLDESEMGIGDICSAYKDIETL